MRAVIDVGSNTIRMLVGEYCDGSITPHSYHRDIARLAGDFSRDTGLSEVAMQRAIATLKSYKNTILSQNVSAVRIVGTAALRRAGNRQLFLEEVFASTGLEIEVISGDEEALLTTIGVLSAVDSAGDSFLVVDIGGGSTELICVVAGQVVLQKSYPLGVVRLCEECSSALERQSQIDEVVNQFIASLVEFNLVERQFRLIGTAGTITTLAAIHLQLKEYDAALVNNCVLSAGWLDEVKQQLEQLSVAQREQVAGMEPGRGDLIIPGIQILSAIMHKLSFTHLKVADAGLLEGVFLQMGKEKSIE